MTDPETDARLARAEILVDAGRAAAALALLLPAPGNARAWCLVARCQLDLDDHDAALQAARQALALDPESEWAHRLAALAATRQRRFDLAREHADEAVRLAPWEWRTHLQRAEVGLAAGDLGPTTAAAADRALELAPAESAVHNLLGRLALREKDNKAAERAFREALRLAPDDPIARNNLAVVQLRRRRVSSAGRHFVAALRLDPTSTLAAQNLRIVLRTWALMLSVAGFVGAWIVIESTRDRSVVSGGPTVPGGVAHTYVLGSQTVTVPAQPTIVIPDARSVPVRGRPAALVAVAIALVAALVIVALLVRRSIGRSAARILLSGMRRDPLLLGTVACCIVGIVCVAVAAAIGLPAGRDLVKVALAVNIAVVLLTRLLVRATSRRA